MNTNPFHYSEEESKRILDDFQHAVEQKIAWYGDNADFPKQEKFHLEGYALNDYLFDKQAILDSRGSEKSRYTIAGLIIMLPIIVLALLYPANKMPWGEWSIFIAAAAGVVLWVLYAALKSLIIRTRIRSYDRQHPDEAAYVAEVLAYEERKK